MIRRSLFFVALLSLGACVSSRPAGTECTASSDCSGGLCLQSQDFPSGYCTHACQVADPSSCPSGSVCIDDPSGAPADAGVNAVCYQACTTNADCTRTGYACLEKAGHMVCRRAL